MSEALFKHIVAKKRHKFIQSRRNRLAVQQYKHMRLKRFSRILMELTLKCALKSTIQVQIVIKV